jgi:hypothetical protein
MEREDTARRRPTGRLGVVDVLRDWSEGLCFVTDLTPGAMAHAIGTAPPVMDGLGHGRLEPPPAGLAWVLLVGGPVAHLDIGLDRRVVDRADLESRFGTGRSLPRVDYDRPYVLAYEVSVAGASARCAVFGRFDDEPTTGNVEASGITLRIDPR